MNRRFVFALLVCFSVLLGAATATQRTLIPASGNVDWPAYNNDSMSDRYVSLDAINTSNVSGLHTICTLNLGRQLNFQSGPIVVDGVLYATTSNQTIAIDATTCAVLWTNTYALSQALARTNRGAAYANGLLFRGFGDGHVIAISAATGATVWNQDVIASGSLEFITGAPATWNTSVIVGTAGGEGGQACHVLALDQSTGALVWMQQTVPNLGSTNAKTWKGATHIAGGATWSSFTIDPTTGDLYVPVGNPGPDFDDRDRLGRDLYTVAVMEFNATTGAFLRSMQFDPQDVHDWDQAATPTVAMLANGSKIALVAGKDGYLRSVDAKSLAQLWQTPITTIENATAPIVPAGTHYCPEGAVYWNGAAYSPATGLAYVNAADHCVTVELEATPAPYVPGKTWLGSADGYGRRDPTVSGWLSAVNATTGAVAWTYHATRPLISGVTPTAGGLVFTADLLGNVLAFNASSGALLAKVATGLPVGGGVISYAVAGTQYVAVSAGLASGNFGTGNPASAIVILGL
jgi:alcohol dehydrogenase (cytochrome c)